MVNKLQEDGVYCFPLEDVKEELVLGKGEFGPCVCHFSRFDLRMSGRQIEGRATQRLVRVNLELEGGELYATGIEGVPFGEAPTDG